MKNAIDLINSLTNKRVLFITTKNLDYLRNTQEIELLRTHASEVDVIGSRSSSYVKRMIYVYKELLFAKMSAYDVCVVGFAPQLILPVWGRKLKRNTELIIDFFISVYDTLCFDRKKFKPDSIPGKLCKWLDVSTLKQADHVICDTAAHGTYFIDEFDANEDEMYRLFLKADMSIYSTNVADASLRATTSVQRKKVLYFGSILPLQGVEVILDAIRQILEKDNTVVDDSNVDATNLDFEIIGPISDSLNRPVNARVQYIDWLSQQDLAKHIAEADLCLAGHFSKDIMKAQRTIPGKAYIYEAMDKPMILGDSPANHELFTPDCRHKFVRMGDSLALAKAILDFFK